MKQYVKPSAELVRFENEDIITTSGNCTDLVAKLCESGHGNGYSSGGGQKCNLGDAWNTETPCWWGGN